MKKKVYRNRHKTEKIKTAVKKAKQKKEVK